MPALDAVKAALAAVDEDLAALTARRSALEGARKDLASALAALEGLEQGSPKRARSTKRGSGSGSASPKRPTVTPDDLVGAVRELGGTATVEQLVEAMGLPDGRSLNGARRQAVDAERVSYADRVYSLPSADPRWPDESRPEEPDAEDDAA